MARQLRFEFARDQKVYGYELLDAAGEIIDVTTADMSNIAIARNLSYVENNGDASDAFQIEFLPNLYRRVPVVCSQITVFTDVEVYSVRLRSDDTATPQAEVGVTIGEVDSSYVSIVSNWIFNRQFVLKQQKEPNVIFVKLLQSSPASDRHVTLPVEPDDTRIAKIKSDARLGRNTPLLDVMTLQLGTSALAVTAINILVDGGGYDALTGNGISGTNAIKVLSIYNQDIDVRRIETEKGINLIRSDFSATTDFNDYLISLNMARLAPAELSKLYSDININNAVYDWYRGKVSITV
jgi:hypothetical protein